MSNPLAIILALTAMFFWSAGDFLIHRTCKRISNFQALIYVNLIGAIILLPFAFNYFYQLSLSDIAPLIILSLIDLAFGLTLLKAYELGKLSVVEVVLTFELPLTIFFGLMFFHESLSWLQAIIILFILSGIFFISRENKTFFKKIICFFTGQNLILEKGILIAFIAAFFSALYNFLIAYNARNISPLLTIWLPWTISLFCLLLFFCFRNDFKKGIKILIKDIGKNKKTVFFGSAFDAIAWVSYAAAVSRQELAIITAITASYPALAMFYGIRFDKEKISHFQYIGAALALGGSIIIALIS